MDHPSYNLAYLGHDHILFSYINMSCNVGSKKRSTIFSLLIHSREAV